MEAMWTRFLPAIREINKIIADDVIGELMYLEAEFSFKIAVDPKGRFYNINLAGGSLLDQGIYPISFASMLFGKQPVNIKTNACMSKTGVDIRSSHLFEYDKGKAAMINTSLAYYQRFHAIIAGTKGHIDVPDFLFAQSFTVHADGNEIAYNMPYESTGKGHEAQEVMDCIRAGKLQSDIMSLDETVDIMETLDDIRAQNGLIYPEEMEKYTE